MEKLLSGDEKFIYEGSETDLSVKAFWQYAFSNIMDKEGEVAEFLVASALGMSEPTNKLYWTLYDILYRDTRIEVKQSSYYHPWTEKRSKVLSFDIAPREGSGRMEPFCEDGIHRQNDIYVFCIVDGGSFEKAYPLNLDSWIFYVVPTKRINETFPASQKTTGLKVIEQKFSDCKCNYFELKERIDMIIDELH